MGTHAVEREKLLNRLELVSPGLSQRELIEQSSCFVFQDGHVWTFNDEIACRSPVDLPITGAVKSAQLLALLRKLPEQTVEVSVGDGVLVVKGKGRQAGVRMEAEVTMPVDSIERPKKADWRKVPHEFTEAVGLVSRCVADNQSKLCMTCVHCTPEFIEACDHYQVAHFPLATGLDSDTLVRGESIRHVAGIGPTRVAETERWVHWGNPDKLVFSCRKYEQDEEPYPDLSPYLDGSGTPVELPKGLSDATERAEIFSADNADQNLVCVKLRPGRLRVHGEGANGNYSEVKKVKYKGGPMEFYVQPQLLVDLTKNYTRCELAEDRLIVKTGKYVYVTALSKQEA